MSFDPSLATPLDRIRVLVGDTEEPEKLADDTILAMYTLEGGNVHRAAARCAQVLAARHADKATVRGMNITTEKLSLFTHYTELARKLWAQAAGPNSFVMLNLEEGPTLSRGIHDSESESAE